MRNKEEVLIKELLEGATIQEFNGNKEDLRAESKKQILKVQEENRRTYNLRKRKPRIYKKGDLVAIKRTQFVVGIKIQRKFLGPNEVTKMKPNDRYDVVKVGHHEGPVRTSTCAEFMKPWVDNQSGSGEEFYVTNLNMMGTVEITFGLLLCLFIKESRAVQRFEQQPSYTEVNPGQDTLIACKVFNKRGTCSWQKDNKPMGMYPNKYEWSSTNQENGDCSIWVRAAQLEFDDGIWECQVTASDFHTQDALTSRPVRLVVRVPPQRPRIEYNGTQVLPGHNLTTLHGEVTVMKCLSHYGNPPPVLKWFLEQQEITPTRRQMNTTEQDNPRTWLALSVLELTISKENHGRMLRCVAVHESYPTKSSAIDVLLDVMYVPETRLVGIPTSDVEDLKDSVAIRCVATANPKASVLWRKEGQNQPVSLQELLQFSPAIRQHSGLYTCHARNKAGDSQPIRVQVDVKCELS
ncbi:hypothetical protein JTB14_002004 [Gonioctena quinquepunctata]|nr:hypothetical protein JTB14_002004 [Gonioctena quinquepunctata]